MQKLSVEIFRFNEKALAAKDQLAMVDFFASGRTALTRDVAESQLRGGIRGDLESTVRAGGAIDFIWRAAGLGPEAEKRARDVISAQEGALKFTKARFTAIDQTARNLEETRKMKPRSSFRRYLIQVCSKLKVLKAHMI